MKRFDRIIGTLIQLQSKRVVRAQELADRFGVSLRTVYRDMRTLQEAGVPIGSENGVGYYLVDGYHLPPVSFTEEEAYALLTSEKMLVQQGDTSLKAHFRALVVKVRAVLPETQQDALDRLDGKIVPSKHVVRPESDWLLTVQSAIASHHLLRMQYAALHTTEVTERTVEPLAVYFTDQAWVLVAYCHLRQDFREFRLDRIRELKTQAERGRKYTTFNLSAHFERGSQPS